MIKPRRQSAKSAGSNADNGQKIPKATASPTKVDQLEAMLRRPEGATIVQLATALDWQAHSVRGAISGFLKKKRALKIAGEKIDGKERVYRIEE